MGDEGGMTLVKDEQNRSPTYRRASLYAEDECYTNQLSSDQLYKVDPQHTASRHYHHWTDPVAADGPLMDSGEGIDNANLFIVSITNIKIRYAAGRLIGRLMRLTCPSVRPPVSVRLSCTGSYLENKKKVEN